MDNLTVGDLNVILWMNIINNNMVTMDGVNLDMESYGPDVKEIKGKKKSRPTPVVRNIVEIPD